MPILAVGAAFPFIAGELRQAPPRLQRIGMEWFFRLCIEPKRLWRRYALLNPAYVALVLMQCARVKTFDTRGLMPESTMLFG
jgi:UDP-N-acetyl-D-mannosaminuronic acid transferase (WecB/TagA/CpsF family)